MKVYISIVPPGGGEQDYGVEVELPALPQVGDYISIFSKKDMGTTDLIVNRVRWILDEPEHENSGECKINRVGVIAEMAHGHESSESHKRSLKMYANRGHVAQTFEDSGY